MYRSMAVRSTSIRRWASFRLRTVSASLPATRRIVVFIGGLPLCSASRLAVRPAAYHEENSLKALSRTSSGSSLRRTYLRARLTRQRHPTAPDLPPLAAGTGGNRFGLTSGAGG